MRKFVVLLVALLALFTFIRDYPSATPSQTSNGTAKSLSSMVQ